MPSNSCSAILRATSPARCWWSTAACRYKPPNVNHKNTERNIRDGSPALSRGRPGRARISRHAQAQHQSAQAADQFAGYGARLQRIGGYIRFKSKLDPRLRELAILQVGWMEKSEYEFTHHVKIGREFGVTDDDIAGLMAET